MQHCSFYYKYICFFVKSKANNLYGMSQYLPIGGYQWVSESAIERDFNNATSILNLKDDADIGFIFGIDLHYPPELHEKHNDFPFCSEKRSIPGITKDDELLLTFYDIKKYIVHYLMLKLALEHDLILKKIHRVLQFKQSDWLKPYIVLNTKLCAQAKNEFEEDFYKLLNNSIYGKTCENKRLRSDIRLITKWDGRVGGRNLNARPNLKKCKVFDENLASIEIYKSHILIDRPIIVGMCILEISKVLMYKFLYNYLPKYGQNVAVIYTDTDAFIIELKTNDAYADIRNDPDEFDTWDYPPDNIFGIKRHNNMVVGKLKDELKGKIASESVGIRSKCYTVMDKYE